MKKKLNYKSKGFTIIEVLIVLAIAALILLIVFLAVPALQRNQRNQARRTDAARISGAIITFVSSHQNTLPACADRATVLTEAGTLGQYSLSPAATCATAANNSLSLVAAGAGTPAALATTLTDAVQIVTGGVCNTSNDGSATNANATSRSVALQYTTETGTAGVSSPNCLNVQ